MKMQHEFQVVNLGVALNTGKGIENRIQAVCDEYGANGWYLVNFQNYDMASKFMLIITRVKNEESFY